MQIRVDSGVVREWAKEKAQKRSAIPQTDRNGIDQVIADAQYMAENTNEGWVYLTPGELSILSGNERPTAY
jgi:hypothetical protein